MNGIADPLRQLPTLYALIDVTEVMILEGMEKDEDRERYWLRTYTPPPGTTTSGELPRGWSRDDEMAAFDSLMD
ncbi:hypothetical protein SEA_SOOS_51 [Gordonia phage Soos]|nr:hypothetical protein SEA_SOOS_51 [Gordonia phage Soos]